MSESDRCACPDVCPYPGLRPFTRDEAEIFFGRDDQTDQLLEKLNGIRFLTVVGSSGCGKSSLVRAGLMADLEGGLMSQAGAHWEIAEMRPGNDPFLALADALLAEESLRSWVLPELASSEEMQYAIYLLRAALRIGPLGLVNVLKQGRPPIRTNFLLLVDQFEEIFSARNTGLADETDAFVALLLATATQRELPFYVVITMRSDYLGNCTVFPGLPEIINESQFLTPRLDREQRTEAIVGPANLFCASIEGDLLNELLNETGPSEDQLPILQHLLMRMWTLAANDSKREGRQSRNLELTRAHYSHAGGLKQAISKHALEAYNELTSRQKQIAQKIFRALCGRGPDNREMRRLATVETIAAITDATTEEIISVANVFRRRDRSFLMPPADKTLTAGAVLDISHEALIRNWDQLGEWVDTEAKSAENYLWLQQAARRWQTKKGGLFRGSELKTALAWEEQEKPTDRWASRYGTDYELAIIFLRKSERMNRYRKCLIAVTAFVLLISVFLLAVQRFAATEKVAELGTLARNQSDEFLSSAEDLLKQDSNPQAKALALSALSRAIQRDRYNVNAIEIACDLLLKNSWCPPLTPPLRYASDSSILGATLVSEGTAEKIFAVSQDGWLLGWSNGEETLQHIRQLVGGSKPSKTAIVSASFSKDGRELFIVPPPSLSGSGKARFWRLEMTSQYEPLGEVDITDTAPSNTVSWSADGKLLVLIPTRWDRPPVCQAFALKGDSYASVPKPFDGDPIVAAAISEGSDSNELIATGSPKGIVQLWRWNGLDFVKLVDAPGVKGAFDMSTRPFSLAFGPGKNNLTMTTSDPLGQFKVKILDIDTGDVQTIDPPTPRDQFMRFVLGPSNARNQLFATALYGRVILNDVNSFDFKRPATVPIGFQGTAGFPVFSHDARELLTLSGAVWIAMDTVQIWDLSFRSPVENSKAFRCNGEPAPQWLADLARAVSGVPRPSYEEFTPNLTLESVRAQAAPETIREPYAVVWRHFFPEEASSSEKQVER